MKILRYISILLATLLSACSSPNKENSEDEKKDDAKICQIGDCQKYIDRYQTTDVALLNLKGSVKSFTQFENWDTMVSKEKWIRWQTIYFNKEGFADSVVGVFHGTAVKITYEYDDKKRLIKVKDLNSETLITYDQSNSILVSKGSVVIEFKNAARVRHNMNRVGSWSMRDYMIADPNNGDIIVSLANGEFKSTQIHQFVNKIPVIKNDSVTIFPLDSNGCIVRTDVKLDENCRVVSFKAGETFNVEYFDKDAYGNPLRYVDKYEDGRLHYTGLSIIEYY